MIFTDSKPGKIRECLPGMQNCLLQTVRRNSVPGRPAARNQSACSPLNNRIQEWYWGIDFFARKNAESPVHPGRDALVQPAGRPACPTRPGVVFCSDSSVNALKVFQADSRPQHGSGLHAPLLLRGHSGRCPVRACSIRNHWSVATCLITCHCKRGEGFGVRPRRKGPIMSLTLQQSCIIPCENVIITTVYVDNLPDVLLLHVSPDIPGKIDDGGNCVAFLTTGINNCPRACHVIRPETTRQIVLRFRICPATSAAGPTAQSFAKARLSAKIINCKWERGNLICEIILITKNLKS